MRILLPGGCVYHWYMGPSRRRVPSPIPSLMLWSYGITGTELRVAPERHGVSTLLESSRHYQQYIQENLLEQVPIDPAETNPSTSCLFVSFVLPLTILYTSWMLALLLLMKS